MEWPQRPIDEPGCERTDAFADSIHDLRSAATALAGWVEVLRRVGHHDRDRQAALSAMVRNLGSMRRAFDVLDAADHDLTTGYHHPQIAR